MFGQLLDLLQVVTQVPWQLICHLLDLRWHSLRQLSQFLCLLLHLLDVDLPIVYLHWRFERLIDLFLAFGDSGRSWMGR
jgi:hypothetical protein